MIVTDYRCVNFDDAPLRLVFLFALKYICVLAQRIFKAR
jgi:hypothetical protein